MSDAAAAVETPVADAGAAPAADAPAAETSLTAPAADPGAGQGDAAAADGQGAGEGGASEGGATAEGDKPAGEEGAEAQGAPETYAEFTVPEGMKLEGDMLAGLVEVAKAQNLNQAAAQKLVDLGVAQASAIAASFQAMAEENPVPLAQHHGKIWSEQTVADAEIGGAKLETSMGAAQKVFARFATPALGDFLNKTGLSHHPELIRFMTKVNAAMSEDTLVLPAGGSGSTTPPGRNAAAKLYPNMPA